MIAVYFPRIELNKLKPLIGYKSIIPYAQIRASYKKVALNSIEDYVFYLEEEELTIYGPNLVDYFNCTEEELISKGHFVFVNPNDYSETVL